MTATNRLRAAFAANNIPWDPAWAKAPEETQLTIAEHWERRALGEPVFDYRDVSNNLSIMSGFPQLRGSGGLTWRQRVKLGDSDGTFT